MLVLLSFILVATIVVTGAINLAKEAKIIECNSTLNATIVGILLAIATSLPEFATSITSTLIGHPEMALGNVLGSLSFNFLIVCFFNIYFINKIFLQKVSKDSNKLNIFNIIMYLVLLFTYYSNGKPIIMNHISLASLVIFIIYIIGINTVKTPSEDDKCDVVDKDQLKKSTIKFILLTILILVFSILLSMVATKLVAITGLSASVVGALFIGIATSLPELVTCLYLVKTDHFDMAATSVWGSNLFNFLILPILDIISKHPVFTNFDSSLLGLIYLGVFFALINLLFSSKGLKNKYLNIIPSICMIIAYIIFFLI
ncbi:MAG: sodium:calcium antiporter [Mycoplasmatales bacterium]